jgi:hypothetical protein
MYRKMTGCGRTPEDASAARRHVIRTILLCPARRGALSAGPDGTEPCLPPGVILVRTPCRGRISWSTGFPGPSGYLPEPSSRSRSSGARSCCRAYAGGNPCPPARYNRCEPPLTVQMAACASSAGSTAVPGAAHGPLHLAQPVGHAVQQTSPDLFPPSPRFPSLPRSPTGSSPGGPDLEDPWR